MTGKSSKSQALSLRVPNVLMTSVEAYAAANEITKSQAAVHYIRAGIRAEREQHATRDDLNALKDSLSAELKAAQVTREDMEGLKEALSKAIAEQPIQAAPQLPDPDAWKEKSLLDRIMKR